MNNMLLTKILGVSFIFILVAVIALINILRINYHLNRHEIENTVESSSTKLYEVGKRKKS